MLVQSFNYDGYWAVLGCKYGYLSINWILGLCMGLSEDYGVPF